MDGSGTIRVQKRDGKAEAFSAGQLAGAMWRAMDCGVGRPRDAWDLAGAIEIYLYRTGARCVSSAALLEMSLRVLRRVGLDAAAEAMETAHRRRAMLRRRLRVRHETGAVTVWDKSWLAEYAARSWRLSNRTARILAGQVESELLRDRGGEMPRAAVLDILNRRVAQWGLADAVPVDMPAGVR